MSEPHNKKINILDLDNLTHGRAAWKLFRFHSISILTLSQIVWRCRIAFVSSYERENEYGRGVVFICDCVGYMCL